MQSTNSLAQLAALDQRVTGIENGLQSVAQAVTSLGVKIDARSQTNWGPIWAALGVMTTMLGLLGAVVYAPIKESQLRMERDVSALEGRFRDSEHAMKNEIVPRREHEQFWRQYEKTLDRLVQRQDRLERLTPGKASDQ